MSLKNFSRPAVVAVVDDDHEYVDSLVSILIRHGLDAHGFSNVHDCLARMPGWKPDMVLTDYEMPEMNGLEFVHQVRAFFPNIPCLLITGSSKFGLTALATSYGCAAVLPKPFSFAHLLDLIGQHLSFD